MDVYTNTGYTHDGRTPPGKTAEEYGNGYFHPQPMAKKGGIKSPWGITQMFGSFLIGCGLGIAHHFYYAYLDGRTVSNQSWYLAGGNAISYVARIFFAASIGLCIRQWFWKAMRNDSWSLGTIDKLHNVKEDPLVLLSPKFALEFLIRAPLGFLITGFIWSLPIIPIIAPTSLSVHVVHQTIPGQPIQIKNLDLSEASSLPVYAINSTDTFRSQFDQIEPFGAAAGAYTAPSSRALGLVLSTFNGGKIVNIPSPCNGNCTFNQTFYGPTYKCEEVTPQNDDPGAGYCYGKAAKDCGLAAGPVSSLPYSTTWYDASLSNCSGTGVDQRVCANISLSSQDIGAASSIGDGRIWIFYRWLAPEFRDPNRKFYDPNIWEDHRLICRSYNASFNLQRTYLAGGSEQIFRGVVEYINPTNFSLDHRTAPTPGELAAYAINDILFSLLSSTIAPYAGPGIHVPIDQTQLAGSKLVDPIPFPAWNPSTDTGYGSGNGFGIQKPVRNLGQAIEELHFNVTVGMMSIQDLSWLRNETVTSTQFVNQTQWKYNWWTLAAVYGAFFVANILALAIGIFAVMQNHGVYIGNDGFLRIMMTTRNPELDQLVAPVSDGRGDDDEQRRLEVQPVRFGYLMQDPQERFSARRVGFGLPDSVVAFGK